VIESDLAALFVGTEEIPKVVGARPPLFGTPDPQARPATPPAAAPPAAPPSRPAATRPPPALPPSAPPPTEPLAPLVTPEVPAAPTEAAPSTPPQPADPTVASPPRPGPNADVQLSPREAVVKVGETVSVSLVVVGATDLSGVSSTLTYDPSVVEVVEALPGSLLTLDGAPVGTERAIESGRARFRFARAGGVSGSGAVVTLRLRGVKEGESPLAFELLDLQVVGGGGRSASPATGRLTVVP
jgi:hypothetical protein